MSDREGYLEQVNKTLRQRVKDLRDLLNHKGTPEQLLDRLATHYEQPVRPVGEYCKAFEAWAKAIGERAKEEDETDPLPEGYDLQKWLAEPVVRRARPSISTYYREIDAACAKLVLPIYKSSMLGRLIYGGEKLRTEKCPIHKGHWMGLAWNDNDCPEGCQLTGWLTAE